jgi:hypothetical protein
MSKSSAVDDASGMISQHPCAALEKMYLKAYLDGEGYTVQSLHKLLEKDAKQVMKRASLYASCRLAEAETRVRLTHHVHGSFQIK